MCLLWVQIQKRSHDAHCHPMYMIQEGHDFCQVQLAKMQMCPCNQVNVRRIEPKGPEARHSYEIRTLV